MSRRRTSKRTGSKTKKKTTTAKKQKVVNEEIAFVGSMEEDNDFVICPICAIPVEPAAFFDHAFREHAGAKDKDKLKVVCPICVLFYGVPANSPLPANANILHHLATSHAEMEGASANLQNVQNDNNDEGERLGLHFAKFVMEKTLPETEECAICLGEYKCGEEMIRMQCFCLFHSSCVRLWWNKKEGKIECPVHMNDDDEENK